ncbi:MerR family transcriptional regulator [Polaribacter aquimarinus]|uniref:MerR family transcriptional regulator n=1 Tax=Polaribacter aquimarinus TaxID=2100726 RepID=A0A2U2J8Z3_9FLAO|nr:MerR family transcriptional regulator [Polaribacter aquimarinus]PWG04816.1 MerR family transcriptional regulator [Polaribacter aquimarinus]
MNNIKQDFTIKDLENISGIKAHTIRIWEKRYDLLHPKRTNTNIRYYSNDSVQKLLNIVLLNKNNFKISKIAKMSDEELLIQSRELAFSSGINDEAINSFKLSMFQFDKVLFNNTYNKLLHKKTFREIFKDVFIPFLADIGLMWQTDTLLPAHEHFISNLIAQKIQINTEKLQYSVTNSNKSYVLFLPENEIHELGLLYLNYELVLRGNHTIYLGQSLPLDNLDYFFKNGREICFITSMTVMPYDDKIKEYFKVIDSILVNTNHELIAIGRKTKLLSDTIFNSNIQLHCSVSNLLKVL